MDRREEGSREGQRVRGGCGEIASVKRKLGRQPILRTKQFKNAPGGLNCPLVLNMFNFFFLTSFLFVFLLVFFLR